MVGLGDKGAESEDMNSTSPDRGFTGGNQMKTCIDCGTTRTPLWRGGPAGPKSLCNACGIKSRKKRMSLIGLNKTSEVKKSKKRRNGNNHRRKFGELIKRKILAFGKEVVTLEKLRRKLGEEEQAAVLLMALSCGSVYA